VSQRRSGPRGLFSRAEDKVKLSDDEIEEALLDPRQLSIFISCAPRSCGRSAAQTTNSRSTNAVNFSSARITKRSQLSLRLLVSAVRSIGGYKPPVPVPKTQSAFHPRAPRTVDCRRGASAIQIVRPSGSTADTQPQLQPALLRLAAINFAVPLLRTGLCHFAPHVKGQRDRQLVSHGSVH
jgi:hypothetical protein